MTAPGALQPVSWADQLSEEEESFWNDIQDLLAELPRTRDCDAACVAQQFPDLFAGQAEVAAEAAPLPPEAVGCLPVMATTYADAEPAPRVARVKRVACEACFTTKIYPDPELILVLAQQDGMSVQQVKDWFINKRARTGRSETKKPGISSDYNVIIDWLVENPTMRPSRELKVQWGVLLGKTPSQISQWITNLKKPGRKNALLSRGVVSITSGTLHR
jgi:hypothetical protein